MRSGVVSRMKPRWQATTTSVAIDPLHGTPAVTLLRVKSPVVADPRAMELSSAAPEGSQALSDSEAISRGVVWPEQLRNEFTDLNRQLSTAHAEMATAITKFDEAKAEMAAAKSRLEETRSLSCQFFQSAKQALCQLGSFPGDLHRSEETRIDCEATVEQDDAEVEAILYCAAGQVKHTY